MLMRKAIPTAPFLPFYSTNRSPEDGRNIFLRIREAEDPEAYALFHAGDLSSYPTRSGIQLMPRLSRALPYIVLADLPGISIDMLGVESARQVSSPGAWRLRDCFWKDILKV
jgi:hypothetical protein